MKRSDFIKHSLALSGGFFLTKYTGAECNRYSKNITLFHTNDIHSRIDPFPENHKKYGSKGGLLGLKALYDKERPLVENALLLDCGDIFQGTPYFNFYKGQVEYELMSAMNFDASTLGNHDFDNGIEGLTSMAKYRNFPILNSNYKLEGSGLEESIKEHIIIEREHLRIGIFGLGIDLKGLVPEENYAGVIYQDPISIAKEKARYLKKTEKCDLIICLSHLGYQYKGSKVSDQVLAQNSTHIDVILGGHTHTFLDKPQIFLNAQKKPIIVNQAGWAALKLGQINLKLK